VALSENENHALKQFKDSLQQALGAQFTELKLFGSKARGDDRPDSDIDVLVIVTDGDWRICDVVYGIATDILLQAAKMLLENQLYEDRRIFEHALIITEVDLKF